ncbi:MAG: extracellular solute-binding protein [Actinomycetota bacterium]|nr:extracellular solute-binding protein [Actinomycetota bacterium]
MSRISPAAKRRPTPSRRMSIGTMVGAALALGVVVPAAASSASAAAGAKKSPVPVIGTNASLTMTEWNWDTVADSPDSAAILPAVIKGFEKKYPHIKVVNTSMSLGEQTDKLPLALATASSAPTVSQTNEGFGSMGRLVTDKELVSLNAYSNYYHWAQRVGNLSLQINSFTPDGVNFGQGNVYGVPWSGAVVGVFYNKAILAAAGAKPPTSWATFVNDLALVHKAGKTVMSFAGGQPTEYQPEHDLQFLLDHYVSASSLDNWIFHKGSNPTIDTKAAIQAAQTYVSWAKDGYLSPGYQGTGVTQALNLFDNGKAAFFIEGNWHIGAVQSALGNKAGFWVPPTATGGTGEGWSIPAKTDNAAAAAAWIDWTVSPQVQAMQLKAGNIPVTNVSAQALASVPAMARSATVGWKQDVQNQQLVPFMDWAAPPLLNSIAAGVSELLAGQTSPSALMASLQSQYTTWASSHYKK